MKLMRIALAAALAAPLAACGGGISALNPFVGTVHPEAASVRADGSLVPGRGKPDTAGTWWRSSAEKDAEAKTIERDAPYGVAPGY